MVRCSLLIFIIFLETLQAVYCVSGKDSLNPSNSRPNKKTDLNNSEPIEDRGLFFGNDEGPSGQKTIEKRRLLFNEGEINSPAPTARELENAEFSARRQTNYTITETDTQVPEYPRGFNNWESKQNVFSLPTEPGHSRNMPDFRLRQPFTGQTNPNLNWRQRTDIFGTEQSWNEENNIKQTSSPEFNRRFDNNYNGRVAHTISDGALADSNLYPNKNGELLNRRLPMTTLNEEGLISSRKYENREMVGDVKSDYLTHSGMNYYNRNPAGFWNSRFYTPDKGLVINFNTECPMPRQLSNQMVHKFIFTPKSSVSNLQEISPFQIPGTPYFPTQKRPQMYYL